MYRENIQTQIMKNTGYCSLGDFEKDIIEYEVDSYKFYNDLLRSNYNSIVLIGLYHIWEQQLKSFFKYYTCELDRKGNNQTKLGDIKDVIEKYENNGIVRLHNVEGWKKINELRKEVNKIKHGNKSKKTFVNEEWEYYMGEYSKYDINSTLNGGNVRMDCLNIDDYKKALIDFWNDLPWKISEQWD